MKNVGENLGLQLHLVGKKKRKKLAFGGDVEGHLGKDGHFYMLDFSRVLPPVRPNFLPPLPSSSLGVFGGGLGERQREMYHNSHLYLLFRQEFLKKYKAPLCSDGYSRFAECDPNR